MHADTLLSCLQRRTLDLSANLSCVRGMPVRVPAEAHAGTIQSGWRGRMSER
jgi:hypothetical protein